MKAPAHCIGLAKTQICFPLSKCWYKSWYSFFVHSSCQHPSFLSLCFTPDTGLLVLLVCSSTLNPKEVTMNTELTHNSVFCRVESPWGDGYSQANIFFCKIYHGMLILVYILYILCVDATGVLTEQLVLAKIFNWINRKCFPTHYILHCIHTQYIVH